MPKLGRYETIEELGRGGTAVVYRARDTATEREVAVKVLSAHVLQDPNLLARFEREIKLAVRLEHPHIASILDVGVQGEHPYIVMRLLPGGNLADRIRRGPLSTAETVRILQEVASALDEAHRHNIVHRDLKPSNILFDQRGTAYLADFGVARLIDTPDSLTASAGVVGTPAYMSPEQLKGQPISGLADQYALGLVAFHALTARLPYEGSTGQMILQQLQEPLPSVRRYNSALSPAFERALARATAKDPSRRFATASEFAAALAAAAAEAPLPAPPSLTPDQSTREDFALMTPPPMTRLPLKLNAAAAAEAEAVLAPAAPETPPQSAPLPPAPVEAPAAIKPATAAPPARRDWRLYGLVVATLAALVLLGWQWLGAAPPSGGGVTASPKLSDAATEPATAAPLDTALVTPAGGGFVTLDPDALGLAIVSLPAGSASAAVYDEPGGTVMATLPDQAIVQLLSGPQVTPDDLFWFEVRVLAGQDGWVVASLLRVIGATTAAPTTTTTQPAGSATPGANVTVAPTRAPGQSGTATQASGSGSGSGGQPPATTTNAPPATQGPGASSTPPATAQPPASSTPASTATTAPSATAPPPTQTPVPPTNPPPTNTPGVICTVAPALCP